MRIKLPLLNAINFAIIFGVITHFANEVSPSSNLLFISNPFLNALIWLIIGGIIGFAVSIIPSPKNGPMKRRHHMPDKVSTKLVLIPTILLILLIAVSAVYMAGHSPFEFAGHTTAEETEEVIEEVEEEIIEEEVEDVDYDRDFRGVCEEKTGIEKIWVEAAGDYTHEVTWEETEFGCNIKRDCIQQMPNEDPNDIRCTASM